MNYQLYIMIALIVMIIVMLVSDRIPYIAVSMIILATLTVSGILSPNETFGKLADPIMMLFVGPFILSAAFQKVGLTESLGAKALAFTSKYTKSESVIVLSIAMATAVMSIVLQALGVQMAMMTLVITMADKLRINQKRALIALGYAATVGSAFTLLGNNVNMLAKGVYEAARPDDTYGLFYQSRLTIPLGIFLIVFFCFVGMYVIKNDPKEEKPDAGVKNVPEAVEEALEETAHIHEKTYDSKQQTIVLIALAFFIIMVAWGNPHMPYNVVVIIVAFTLGLTKVMSIDEMLASINWKVMLFSVGLMTLSGAVSKVGLDIIVSDMVQHFLGGEVSLRAAVAVFFLFTTIMTQFMSNSGAFSIMTPIALAFCTAQGIPLKPIIMAISVGGTFAFLTPMATPSYAMLASAGGIRFKEFVKAGFPMMVLTSIVVIVMLPILYG